jgi:hypothetical protein
MTGREFARAVAIVLTVQGVVFLISCFIGP